MIFASPARVAWMADGADHLVRDSANSPTASIVGGVYRLSFSTRTALEKIEQEKIKEEVSSEDEIISQSSLFGFRSHCFLQVESNLSRFDLTTRRTCQPRMSASVARLGVASTTASTSLRSRFGHTPPRAMPNGGVSAGVSSGLESSPGTTAFATLPVLRLPPIGCSPATELQFVKELCNVCHTVGFFYIAGIDDILGKDTRDGALAAANRFFAMPQKTKEKMANRNSPQFRGYVRLGAENTAGRPDFREQVEFGVDDEMVVDANDSNARSTTPHSILIGPNQWPGESDCPRFKTEIETFLNEIETLSVYVMELLALSLDLPRDFFKRSFGDMPNVQMKIARYPRLNREGDEWMTQESPSSLTQESFGVGAHTDSGYLSLLLQDHVGGLQVQNDRGDWIDAPPVPNTLVVNLGEMLQLCTNGYYLATPHRVRNSFHNDRVSVPYFWNPSLDHVCEPIDLPESIEWLRTKPTIINSTSSHGEGSNTLLPTYGANALKSLARSHPEVMKRHHPDLKVEKDGTVAHI